MNFNNRTAHWVRSLELWEMAMAEVPAHLTYDQKIALAQLHATCAGVGGDLMGLQAARAHLLQKREDGR